jgi:hypothetical protein
MHRMMRSAWLLKEQPGNMPKYQAENTKNVITRITPATKTAVALTAFLTELFSCPIHFTPDTSAIQSNSSSISSFLGFTYRFLPGRGLLFKDKTFYVPFIKRKNTLKRLENLCQIGARKNKSLKFFFELQAFIYLIPVTLCKPGRDSGNQLLTFVSP